ncbi:unknown [Clostridium sp. CAG:575]|nr:unknown [Clostridium sp. CAG:575]
MIPRKKRILIITISIILVISVIVGIFIFLLLKTDLLKTKEELFSKYFVQNFQILDALSLDNKEIDNTLENNKYSSSLIGTVQYTEDMNTSNENTNSEINNYQFKANSEVDKTNQYIYSKIEITDKEEKLAGFEYINDKEIYGIKLDGIRQFVSIDTGNVSELSGKTDFDIEKLKNMLEDTDFKTILKFSEQEKQQLQNTYLDIIKNNVSKENYGKQNNNLITVNNHDVQANAYYLKLTVEEYNNLYIKILQQITNDEVLLGKIDEIEKIIKNKNPSYESDTTLREQMIEKINKKIKEIEDNNIGQEEVKITVYESNEKTVRTTVEKTDTTLTLDVYNNIVKIDNTKLGENEKEQIVSIEKNQANMQNSINIGYEEINNNEINVDYQLSYGETMNDSNINKTASLQINNQKNKAIVTIKDDIKLLDTIETNTDWINNNLELNDYDKTQVDVIINAIKQTAQEQITNIKSKFSENDFKTMLENLGLTKKTNIEISDIATVTETEKNRYNSQFEFFVSTNLTKDNIKDLLEVTKNNFSDAKFYTKDGQLIDIDIEKIKGNNDESKEYKNNISELVIILKENSTNEDKQEKMLEFLNSNDTKYNVSIQYDKQNGLAQLVRIELQENER